MVPEGHESPGQLCLEWYPQGLWHQLERENSKAFPCLVTPTYLVLERNVAAFSDLWDNFAN